MNKKKLSVVMAGAMLATSVAPVLAAEVTAEDSKLSEKSLLAKKVVDLAKTELISSNSIIGGTGATFTDFVTAKVGKIMKQAKSAETAKSALSAYGIKVLDKSGKAIDLTATNITSMGTGSNNGFKIDDSGKYKLADNNTIAYDVKTIEDILTSDKLVEDMTVQIVKRKTTEFLGQIIPGTQIEVTGGTAKYTVDAFSDAKIAELGKDSTKNLSSFIKEVKANDSKTGATITLKALKNISNEKEGNVTIELDTTKNQLNFDLALDANGKITDKIQECVGFAEVATYQKSAEITAAPEVKSAYKMVDDSKKHEEETLLASDLYDGLALTARGTEIQTDIENAKKVNKETKKALTVELGNNTDLNLTGDGVASFTVTYFASHKDNDPSDTNDKPSKVITVKSTNLKEIQSLYNMLTTGEYTVGIVGGNNRYETAVNVAKKQGVTKLDKDATMNNIILVNGTSLVDGLAAAPLAASLTVKPSDDADTDTSDAKSAPLLLSNTDSLPEATKEYLVELTNEIAPGSLKNKVTINLVGGEGVLSKSLEKELKEMGFNVERFGGDNREETSLEVSSKVLEVNSKTAVKNNAAFVVGANGEADAMSVASEAANKKTPIIVAKAGGLTKDVVRFIEKYSENGDVDVIGGESVVSKDEYDKIDEVTTGKIDRVAGDNRFETNAAIIKKYATAYTEAILVKDGQSNKDELIDALSAANYADGKPIVLAKDKISESQKIALLDKKGAVNKLTQIGQGVARPTLEAVAEFLGLSNVK